MMLIGLLLEGKRIINVDESAIGQGVFYRSGWGLAGSTISQNVKPFGQRLSLLAAVDTDGLTYFALSQSNTDARVFGAFLFRLAACLDAEDPDWRSYTVIMLDGASYHVNDEARRALAALAIPAVFAGPYGYDGSPAEKLFAHLKVGDINPACLKTGRK